MTPLRPTPRPFSRFALLLAALLHLLGAAAGPAVHARLAEASVTAEQRGGGERERPDSPAHDERTCAVCQGHESPALLEAGSRLAVAPAATDAESADTHRNPHLRIADAPRARGPPHLS